MYVPQLIPFSPLTIFQICILKSSVDICADRKVSRVEVLHFIVRDMAAFPIHFFIVHHIKITMHLPYCNHKLVYNNNTKINYILEDYVIFS